jgi:hypothetical protein
VLRGGELARAQLDGRLQRRWWRGRRGRRRNARSDVEEVAREWRPGAAAALRCGKARRGGAWRLDGQRMVSGKRPSAPGRPLQPCGAASTGRRRRRSSGTCVEGGRVGPDGAGRKGRARRSPSMGQRLKETPGSRAAERQQLGATPALGSGVRRGSGKVGFGVTVTRGGAFRQQGCERRASTSDDDKKGGGGGGDKERHLTGMGSGMGDCAVSGTVRAREGRKRE